MAEIGDLAVSTIFIILTCSLAALGRKLVRKFVRREFAKELLNEAIASAELCAACFELIIVADNFGIAAYAIYLFLLTIWWSQQWEDATACPYIHLEDVVKGRKSFRKSLLLIWAQLMGGCCVYRYIQFLWRLELAETHAGRADEDCTADLQVPMLYGAIIEGIATMLCRIASNVISDSNAAYASVMDSFIGTSLVVAAFNYSGGYFNPVLATSLKYGCQGNTVSEHMVVYWLGSILGSIASVYVYGMGFIKPLSHSKFD